MAPERAHAMRTPSENLRRADFPALSQTMNGKRLVFLDTAASAQKPRAVIGAMNKVLETGYANIHRGIYRISQDLTAEFEGVRAKIGRFIGAESEKTIVFTRNATESINLVAQSWGRTHLQAGDEIILTEMEHHANIVPWQLLAGQIGSVIKVVPVMENGHLDHTAFENLLSKKTRLVSCVHVSNAIGTVNDAGALIKTARAFDPAIKILIDGSQAVPHMPVDVRKLDADFYVFTGHKLYGPTGIGVLYGKYEVLDTMPPYQGGGDMIEQVSFTGTTFKPPPARFEAGTPAIVEVIGLGAAVDYMESQGLEDIFAYERQMMAYAVARLEGIKGLRLYHGANSLSVLPFMLEGVHPSDAGMILDQCGVAVRTGHHCCMPLMAHLGVTGTIRASVGLYTGGPEIEALVQGIEKAKDLLA